MKDEAQHSQFGEIPQQHHDNATCNPTLGSATTRLEELYGKGVIRQFQYALGSES